MKKLLKNILLFILIIITTISIFVYIMLDTTKSLLTKESITNLLKQVDMTELIGNEVEDKIYEVLEKTGMPKEYADYVLQNDEFKEYVSTYVVEGVDYIINDKSLPTLDVKETNDTLISSFYQVIDEAKKNNIDVEKYLTEEDQQKIVTKITEYTPEIISKIPEVETIVKNKLNNNEQYQEIINQIKTIQSQLEKIYSYQPLLLILIIIEFVIIIVLNIKKAFKNVAFPFGLNALILFIINLLLPQLINKYYPEELQFIRSVFDEITNQLMTKWNQIIILYFILFIVLIILQIVIPKLFYKKPKDMEIWK